RRLCLAGVLLCFAVVVLGAYVRLTAAGLGCPDWPGCYGHATPLGAEHSPAALSHYSDRPLDPGKAWREMIHRYAAGTLALLILVLTTLAFAARPARPLNPVVALALLATVIVQALLGMLTVTWQLKPLVVTLHLLFGMTTLGLLWWLALSVPVSSWGAASLQSAGRSRRGGALASGPARSLALLGLAALAVQIALGGWTSSNYAAIACPDLPTCQHAWWPHGDFRHAFVLWHGLDVDYEGGTLAVPARVAIHFTHRLGALAASAALALAALYVVRHRGLGPARLRAWAVLAALLLQLILGISMVLKGFPLWLATAHTAGAALLLLAVLALLRSLSTR
ncbi:MAG TPA: COX15/CtaA family protein, partial [Steroidobacteraceae bacterium]|nr:COX15/CtaA family protein [Steroidobacteraceae bacterium]